MIGGLPAVMITAALLAIVSPSPQESSLTRDQLGETLDALEETIATRCSYAAISGDRWREVLASERDQLQEATSRSDAERLMRRVVAAIGDGHASLRSSERDAGQRFRLGCTFIPISSDGRAPIVALWHDRSSLVADQAPFVAAVNGEPIEAWLATAAREVAAGSPQLVRRRAAARLSQLPELGEGAPLTLTLTDRSGDRRLEVSVPPQSRPAPDPSAWPPGTSRLLDAGIGYLRLAQMDRDAERDAIRFFEDTKGLEGLIIDVRGNGGGSRDALRAIAGYLIPENQHVVGNAARPLLVNGEFDEDSKRRLRDRGLRSIDEPTFTPEEQRTVERFVARFKPERQLPDDRFGVLHVMLLAGSARYRALPVVVLQDVDCFSATDIFLSALSELPNVTLVGQASSGGSGASVEHSLPHGFEVRLSTMVSFRPDGSLLDGRGVTPDIIVEASPRQFVRGGEDLQLEAAIRECVARRAK
jgi:C-terminal processing protease CtpA/Prc